MMNDEEMRAAMRGLADRAVPDAGTLTAVRRAGHRIHRRHQAYAATGVAAVLAGAPITVHAVTSSGGSGGHVQVVTPASSPHHRRTARATPTPVPTVSVTVTPTATPTATPTGGYVTPTPSPSPPS